MKLNVVSNLVTVNSPARDNQVSGRRANNPVNVSRGKLKKANLNPASNRISQDRPVSNLKMVSVRDNHNPDNGVSKDRSD